MKIKETIARILNESGTTANSEAYQLSISKTEMLSQLFQEGFDHEVIDNALMEMCDDGSLVLDDTHVLLYDRPVL
ncbi:hypothetical protein [Pedobacter zeae]|uniref:Uncharacterized protein n=1 Tax=Pedobacter zeae TaxID=1737356 RepID=A0A7W6KAT8_9SPHI|nr:hypothetical protein [Pedobacter zeae]MBB4108356.1 hypothetical protein [Pedobacter zeae]GGG93301.1 hypothetical protein GCM10007422_03170 [Pedobacter zeae]